MKTERRNTTGGKRPGCVCVLFSVLLFLGAGSTDSLGTQTDVLTRSTLSADQRLLALSQLWSEARFSFAYYDTVAAVWDKLYQEFVPRVRDAKSDYEYYLELMRFYAHLHDGHSGVFWPEAFDEALGYPPVEIRKIEGRPVVFRLLRQDEELVRNTIRPGVAILEVEGRPAEERVEYWRTLKRGSTQQATDRLAYFRILTGPRNSPVELVVQDPGGPRRALRLTRSEKYFNDTNLDPPRLYTTRELGGGIAYFRANQMHPTVAAAFGTFIERTETMSGLILDVRYNGGGSDLVGFDMVSRLIGQPVDGPIHEVTTYRADRRAFREPQDVIRNQRGRIMPAKGRRFGGPMVVLIGEQTHSATESGLLALLRTRTRTIFVGEPTAGSTGQPLAFALAGGGTGVVCSRRTLAPDGRPFVGIGLQPDVLVRPTQEDLFADRDRVLERAIELLKSGGGF